MINGGRAVKHLEIPAGLIWWHCFCRFWRKHRPIPKAARKKKILYRAPSSSSGRACAACTKAESLPQSPPPPLSPRIPVLLQLSLYNGQKSLEKITLKNDILYRFRNLTPLTVCPHQFYIKKFRMSFKKSLLNGQQPHLQDRHAAYID